MKRFKIRVPIQAELTVEAESEEAITRYLASFTLTDACTDDCVYGIPVMRGTVQADLWYDPVLVRGQIAAVEIAEVPDAPDVV